MLNELRIKLPHITLAALSNFPEIDPERPTLLFLHGYLDNANSFADLIPELHNWQCLAVDMAGHGFSEHRSMGAHYHLTDYAYDLHQIISEMKLSQVVLVGHSLGAIVCSLYAATQAKQVYGFVAIESCGPLSEPEETTSLQLSACFESRQKAQSPIKEPTSLERVIKARCTISDLTEAQANKILSRNLDASVSQCLRWRTDKRLRTASAFRMTENQALDIMRSIACPRILILGNQGFDKIKVAVERRKSVFDNVPIFTYEGGHHVHMSATKDVALCIQNHAQAFIIQ